MSFEDDSDYKNKDELKISDHSDGTDHPISDNDLESSSFDGIHEADVRLNDDTKSSVEYTEDSVLSSTSDHLSSSEGIPIKNTVNENAPGCSNKGGRIKCLSVILALLIVIGAGLAVIFYSVDGGIYSGKDKVGVIYVQGTMVTGNVPSGMGIAASEEISESLQRATADDNVKAIVLRINSPGGSPAASEEIVREISKVQDKGIPVVVSMGDSAASAAYYISASTDYIIANPSTVTGAIGVMWVFQDLSAFYEDEGIDFHVAKSGEFKDMGVPWRELTDAEKEYADRVVMELFDHFVDEVAQGRNMSHGEVKDLADGRIYTGYAAKEHGLIDDFGNLYDAIEKAAELGGIENEYQVVYINRPTLSRLLFGSENRQHVNEMEFTDTMAFDPMEESRFGKLIA